MTNFQVHVPRLIYPHYLSLTHTRYLLKVVHAKISYLFYPYSIFTRADPTF